MIITIFYVCIPVMLSSGLLSQLLGILCLRDGRWAKKVQIFGTRTECSDISYLSYLYGHFIVGLLEGIYHQREIWGIKTLYDFSFYIL